MDIVYFIICLEECKVNLTHNELFEILLQEAHQNWEYYKAFAHKEQDILRDLNEYIRKKIYTRDTIDLVVSILCNALKVSAIIYTSLDGTVVEHREEPAVSRGNIHLVLTGSGVGAHYEAAVPTSSVVNSDPLPESQIEFIPEHVVPYPRAPARKEGRKRKARKTAILTDTLEKEAIRNEQRSKGKPKKPRLSANKVKPTKTLHQEKIVKCATKQRKVQRLNRERDCSSDKEDDDTYCLVCLDPFSNSKSREQWVQCFQCKKWSHEKCVEAGTTYICHNCYSDDSDFFH